MINFPVNEMVEFIRQHDPSGKVKVVVGGPLIGNHARNYQGDALESALGDMGADIYVVESQGEATLAQLVRCLKAGGDLSEVGNLLYFEGGRLHSTSHRPEVNSLEDNAIVI